MRRVVAACSLVAALLLPMTGIGASVPGDPSEELEPENGIGPGSTIWFSSTDLPCTANFVYEDADGNRYLGSAGHCVVPDDKRATHGPFADWNASGVRVRVAKGCQVTWSVDRCASERGIRERTWWELGDVVYAWDGHGDFVLVEIPPRHYDQVRTRLPHWGGPDGVTAGLERGETILLYGQGTDFHRTPPTRSRSGQSLGGDRVGWSAVGLGASGDSGASVVVAEDGSPPYEGGAAVGWVTGGVGPVEGGPSFPHVQVDVLCYADLRIRVVPNGSFLDRCPRHEAGSEGRYGTVMSVDRVGDAEDVTEQDVRNVSWVDASRVWFASNGSALTVTFRVADLQRDQFRSSYRAGFRRADGRREPRWYVTCDAGPHEGVISDEIQCFAGGDEVDENPPLRGYWNVTRDVVWTQVPYSYLGLDSGAEIGRVWGKTKWCTSRPTPEGEPGIAAGRLVCPRADVFEGGATHTLS